MKKVLALTLPIGLLIHWVYLLLDKFEGELPQGIVYLMMTTSILLMFVGLAYHGYCLGKRRSPYKFK